MTLTELARHLDTAARVLTATSRYLADLTKELDR